jgi:hypothetical protein
VARTRVVLAALPKLLADIVRETLAPHPDLEIVAQVGAHAESGALAEVGALAELGALVAATRATVAIVGLAAGESPVCCSALLREHPDLTVIAVTADGRTAYHCEMRMQVSVMTELSARGLLATLHALDGDGVDRDLHLFSLQRTISAADRAPDT